MPTSDQHNILPILAVIQQLEPKSVLDVGCGFGKFGVLLREYLEIWHHRLEPSTWKTTIEAVDAYPGYKNPIWDFVYNKVHLGDIQEVLPRLGNYDVILIADMIEHLELDQAKKLVGVCLAHCKHLVISTPREFYPQQATFENSYEVHRCLWTRDDYPEGVPVVAIPGVSCNVFVTSPQGVASHFNLTTAADIAYLQARMRLKRLGPIGWPVAAGVRALNRLLS